MQRHLRDFLREKWRDGFWFPWFQWSIDRLEHLSLAWWLNKWLTQSGDAPLGASEFYQFALAVIAVFWLLLIDKPVDSLTNEIARSTGSLIVLYFVTELLVFSLHWTFVAEDSLESYRRSLATFLFNLPITALLFTVSLTLAGCQSPVTAWDSFWANLGSILKLELVKVPEDSIACFAMARYEAVIAATLLVIIIASLVGAVVRSQKERTG